MNRVSISLALAFWICPCAQGLAESLPATAWVRTFDYSDRDDAGAAIAVNSTGDIYVVGTAYAVESYSFIVTLKYDPLGNPLWARTRRFTFDGDVGRDVVLDDNDNVYVGAQPAFGPLILKYDDLGNELWARGVFGDDFRRLATDDFGNVYATAKDNVSAPLHYSQYMTTKLNAQGDVQWSRSFNPATAGGDPKALGLDAVGNVYVSGEARYSRVDSNAYDFATIKYDSAGTELWVRRLDHEHLRDGAVELVVDPRGYVYVTGSIRDSTSGNDYGTVKYDVDGNFVWLSVYDAANQDDSASDLCLDGEGNLYVTGVSAAPGAGGYATVKYSSLGTEVWVARFEGPVTVSPRLALGDDGSVTVAGGVVQGVASDYLCIRYGPDGVEKWTVTYGGPAGGADYGSALAVTNDGSLCVTGQSWGGAGTQDDCVTIKYLPACPSGSALAECRPAVRSDLLFGRRYSQDADGIPLPLGDPFFYDSTKVTVTRAEGDTFWLSGSGDSLGPWICDDAVFVNGFGTHHGPYNILDPSYPLCQPIEGILGALPAYDITEMIPMNTSCLTFRLADTQREILGNTEIYLVKREVQTGVPTGGQESLAASMVQVFPMPSSRGATVRIPAALGGPVALRVFDPTGREIRLLVGPPGTTGGTEVTWDGRNDRGMQVEPGVYFYHLSVGTQELTGKLLLAQ